MTSVWYAADIGMSNAACGEHNVNDALVFVEQIRQCWLLCTYRRRQEEYIVATYAYGLSDQHADLAYSKAA